MDFLNKVGEAWSRGIKGTEEVPLEPGIQAVLKTAQKAVVDKEKQQMQEQDIGEKE